MPMANAMAKQAEEERRAGEPGSRAPEAPAERQVSHRKSEKLTSGGGAATRSW